MTKLPEKALLDGSQVPKTTTGEMKAALGAVRDYLAERLGEDGTDKETARATLGVTAELAHKAHAQTVEALRDAVEKEKIPVGTVVYFAAATPSAGYLAADGTAVSRTAYPDRFAAIGTTFGAGDGATTFNLPDLMGRFPEGNRLWQRSGKRDCRM